MNKVISGRIFLILLGALSICTAAWGALEPGKAVDITGVSGEWDSADHCFPFVMYDEGAKCYRMYYTASARSEMSESVWGQRMIGAATSPNALSWSYATDTHEPVLYSRKFYEGDMLNRDDMSRIFDSIHAVGACVIRDGSGFKMWYTGWNGDTEHAGGGAENKINYRIGYVTSPDGMKWTKRPGPAGGGAVLGPGEPGQKDSKGVGQPFVLKEGPTYRMWYEGFDGRAWRIFYATSRDGTNWTRRGVALDLGKRGDPDQVGLRNPVVVKRNGQYELWYQGESVSSPECHIMRATSTNGLTWIRIPGEVVLHPPSAPAGGEGIYVDSVVVQPDNSCQVFFAKENTTPRDVTDGTVQNRRYSIYTELVNP